MRYFLWGFVVGVLATFCFIYFGGEDLLVKMSSQGKEVEHRMKNVEDKVQEKIKTKMDETREKAK